MPEMDMDGAEAIARYAFSTEREWQDHVIEMAERLGWRLIYHTSNTELLTKWNVYHSEID
tara:strand:- start:688 stop:867 length:180 start_codon:yes stop_codon:yes gene_type:complete